MKLKAKTTILLCCSIISNILFSSCENITSEDINRQDISHIMQFIRNQNTTEQVVAEESPILQFPSENFSEKNEISEVDIFPSESETQTHEQTTEMLIPSEEKIADEKVLSSFPDIPQAFSHIPLPESLTFDDKMKEMIKNLNALANRDFNARSVYITTTKPELITPNIQNNITADLKYYRNKLIEEKYNVKLTSVLMNNDGETIYNKISRAVNAGEYISDILCLPLDETSKLLCGGFLSNLRKIPFINLYAPYYNTSLVKESTVKDAVFMLSSDFTFDANEVCIIYYNRDIFENFQIKLPSEYYEENKWTYDSFLECLKAYNDNIDNADKYFLSVDTDNDNVLNSFVTSFGTDYFINTEYKAPVLNLNNQKTLGIIDGLKNIFQHKYNIGADTSNISDLNDGETEIDDKADLYKKAFTEGKALFYVSTLSHINEFSTLPFSWGLLPMPKTDENAKHKNVVSDKSLVVSLVKDIGNTELCGMMSEAFAVTSYEYAKEEYKKEKMFYYLRDITSVKALHEIVNLENLTFSNAPVYGASEAVYSSTIGLMRDVILNGVDFTDRYATANEKVTNFFATLPTK